MTEDKMIGKYHQLNGHEFEQTLGDGEGQRSLVCCSPWGCKESDTTERLNNNLPHQRVHCAGPCIYMITFLDTQTLETAVIDSILEPRTKLRFRGLIN